MNIKTLWNLCDIEWVIRLNVTMRSLFFSIATHSQFLSNSMTWILGWNKKIELRPGLNNMMWEGVDMSWWTTSQWKCQKREILGTKHLLRTETWLICWSGMIHEPISNWWFSDDGQTVLTRSHTRCLHCLWSVFLFSLIQIKYIRSLLLI